MCRAQLSTKEFINSMQFLFLTAKSQVYMNALLYNSPLVYEICIVLLRITFCHATEFPRTHHVVLHFLLPTKIAISAFEAQLRPEKMALPVLAPSTGVGGKNMPLYFVIRMCVLSVLPLYICLLHLVSSLFPDSST